MAFQIEYMTKSGLECDIDRVFQYVEGKPDRATWGLNEPYYKPKKRQAERLNDVVKRKKRRIVENLENEEEKELARKIVEGVRQHPDALILDGSLSELMVPFPDGFKTRADYDVKNIGCGELKRYLAMEKFEKIIKIEKIEKPKIYSYTDFQDVNTLIKNLKSDGLEDGYVKFASAVRSLLKLSSQEIGKEVSRDIEKLLEEKLIPTLSKTNV